MQPHLGTPRSFWVPAYHVPLQCIRSGAGPDRFFPISQGFRRTSRISQAGAKATFASSSDANLCPLSPEPVSHASIQVLGRASANGSCTITLNCTAERGDNVSYSWGSWDTSTLGLCSHNGSLLHLSYPLQNTSIACACTASNPVSRRVVTFNSSKCSYEQGGKFPVAHPALSSLSVPTPALQEKFLRCFRQPQRSLGQGKRLLCHLLRVAQSFQSTPAMEPSVPPASLATALQRPGLVLNVHHLYDVWFGEEENLSDNFPSAGSWGPKSRSLSPGFSSTPS